MSKRHEDENSAALALAQWVASTPGAALPERAIAQARLLVLDTLGCGVAGVNEEASQAILGMVDDLGGAPTCTVIGQQKRTNILNAVLANGALIRVLDLNDYIGGSGGGPDMGGHPSDNIPVALAVGEAMGSSGREILEAIVLGYEIFGRLKNARSPNRVWDDVTISGIVAPAMAGRLMRLDRERLAHAIAFGASRAATPSIVRAGHVSSAKSIANALVAQSGVQGALLAARGATGPLAILESEHGLRDLFTGALANMLCEPVPATPNILRASIKMYPCLATGQAAVAAALKLHEMTRGDIAGFGRIEVAMADYPIVKRQQNDAARRRPQTREAADHSFNFLVAVSLLDGEFGLRQFENDRWLDPEVVGLMDRFVMTTDPDLGARASGAYPCALRVTTSEGKNLVSEIGYPPGFARDGLQEADVVGKFQAITAPHLAAEQRDRIIAAALRLDRSDAIDELMSAVRIESGHAKIGTA